MARKSRKNPPVEVATVQEKKVAIYVRLSREDLQKKGDSLENQKKIAMQHLLTIPELGVPVVYQDNGFTGHNSERPEFQKLLSDVEKGLIECIMVKDLSRLGRNSLETGYYLDKFFPTHGVRFIAINDQFDSSTDQGSILVPLKNMLNEAHAIDLGKKIQASKHQTRLAGGYTGNVVPYGYEKEVGNCHQLLLDEGSAPVVREIYELVAEGTRVSTVVRMLNERKQLSPSDYQKQKKGEKIDTDNQCKWSCYITRKMLQSQMYIGNMEQGKHISINRVKTKNAPENVTLVKNTHEPIVSDELFKRVQEQLQIHSIGGTRQKLEEPNVFVGKIFCGGCGRTMYRNRHHTKEGYKFKYVCATTYRVGASFCEYEAMFKMQEKELLEILGTILNKQAEILLGKNLLLIEKEVEYDSVKAKRDQKLKELENLIKKNQKYLKSLYENLVSNTISPEDYKELKAGFEIAVTEAKKEFIEVQEISDLLLEEIKALTTLSLELRELKQKDLLLSKDVVAKLVDKITIYSGKKIDIQFSFAFPMIDEVLGHGE